MPKRRKEGSKFTTISVSWKDKEYSRMYATFKKETKNGKLYESDAEVFHKMLEFYAKNSVPNLKANSTYPTIHQGTRQQD